MYCNDLSQMLEYINIDSGEVIPHKYKGSCVVSTLLLLFHFATIMTVPEWVAFSTTIETYIQYLKKVHCQPYRGPEGRRRS